MSVFDDEVRAGTYEILDEAGSLASFTAQGAATVLVKVFLDRDVERTVIGMQGAMMEKRTEIIGYSNELGEAGRGDIVTVGATAWRLVSKASDDSHVVTWIVKEER